MEYSVEELKDLIEMQSLRVSDESDLLEFYRQKLGQALKTLDEEEAK